MVVLFKEEDLASHLSHPSCESNPNREESITPTIHQRLLEPRSSNHKYLDHDDVACAGIDIADAREERNSNLTAARLSTKGNHSDGANVAESELNSRAEMYHLVLCNTKKKSGNVRLYQAAINGDWKTAKSIIDKDSSALTMKINDEGDTALHIAVAKKHISFVENLVQLISSSDLTVKNEKGNTALAIASASDIALDIMKKKPELALERRKENGDTALHVFARKPSAIGSGKLRFWKRCINSCFKGIYNEVLMQTLARETIERVWEVVVQNLTRSELSKLIETPSRLLHDAARVGNVEFLIILIRSYPDLLCKFDDNNKSIFHVAVENRQESVFSLIYKIGGLKDVIANYYNEKNNSNMLHLVGTLAAPCHLSRVSGAALQMQRELLWFKEVEKIVVSSHHQMRCSVAEPSQIEIIGDRVDHLTPRELFTKEHKQLLKDGEEHMKNIANSCMLVATLIATIVFVVLFTMLKGNDGNTTIPIFWQNHAFTIFIMLDILAFAASTTSMVSFLSILMSGYSEDDFLVLLPTKLLVGLVMLFISGVCMMAAFSVAFFSASHKGGAKFLLAIGSAAMIPFGYVCVLHSKLLVDILQSVGWSEFSLKQCKRRLF
ncbi:uncharacterized protein LOC111008827 isoform X2 [Momordica charantia]|uniref:Uncharacterized protein LOC111008827 isoform X2 n=1 Tax=Momordica charantia TaxID=3673 RepID=A0A6J1C813_MOMCH|nr:uncharacterized protein LOC111008827 isoform X2 [Momordica charantia]